MTNLQKLVSELENISSAEVVLYRLTIKDIESVNNTSQSVAAVENLYGQEFSITLIASMSAAIDYFNTNNLAAANYLKIYFDRFTIGVGLDFSNELVRNQLDMLVPFLTQDVVDKLKLMGKIVNSKWSLITTDPEPTLEEVAVVVAAEQVKRQIISWVNYVRNGILGNNGNGKSIEELKILIAEF